VSFKALSLDASSGAVRGEGEETTTRFCASRPRAGEFGQQKQKKTGHARRGAGPRAPAGSILRCGSRRRREGEDSAVGAVGPPQTKPVFGVDLCSFTGDCYTMSNLQAI